MCKSNSGLKLWIMMQTVAFDLVRDFLSSISPDQKPPLVVVLGPTASGKTALSLELADVFNGEIISADSRQIYRHMDIGTDKIPLEKRHGIAHHMIDIVDPSERFTVAQFKKESEKIIDDVLQRGKLPILVGGTGFYIDALTKNFELPPENLEMRGRVIQMLQEKGPQGLYEELMRCAPESAKKIHPRNTRYVVRALEIFLATGSGKKDKKNPPRYSCLQIGLSWPREVLFERIDLRVDEQIKRGLLEETQRLLEMGFSKELPSMSSLGYLEMIAHIEGKISLQEVAQLIKKNTRNYAKRQITWFKRDKEINWIS